MNSGKVKLICSVCATLALLVGTAGAQGNQPPKSRSFVTADPIDLIVVKRGKSVPIEVTLHVQNGYHINSSQPLSPELIPTQIGFVPPPDVVIARLQYPAGSLVSFPFDPNEKLSVYSGDVTIKALLLSQQNAAPGTYTVHGELKYQACDNNACYPPKKLPIDFDVKVTVASSKTPRSSHSVIR